MSPWRVVWLKEVAENLRDKRAVASALLYGPLLGPVLFAVMLGVVLGQQREAAEKTLEVPVMGAEYAPGLIQHLEGEGVVVQAPGEDPESAVRRGDTTMVLRIPPEFAERWQASEPARIDLVFDASRQSAHTEVARLDGILQAYGRKLGLLRLQVRGIAPQVASPLLVARQDLSTPRSRSGALLGMVPYFLILSAFIGGMYLAIDATAGERERQSLEPLMLTAAPAGHLLVGKWLATASFSAASLLVCVVAFTVAVRAVPTDGLDIDLRLSASGATLIAALVLPLALFASAAQLLVASFAKTFREAQTYLQVLILVPAIPSVAVALNPVRDAGWMHAVPLLSQSVQIGAIARGQVPTVLHLLAGTGLTLLASLLLGWIAARLFRRQRWVFAK